MSLANVIFKKTKTFVGPNVDATMSGISFKEIAVVN